MGEAGVAELDGVTSGGFSMCSATNHGARGKSPAPENDPPDTAIKKVAIVLDMGEASREQGFRLNGCR